MKPITFWAIVGKVQTMADGGIRVYFDLPEDAILAAAELMACKRAGQVLDVECKAKLGDCKTEKNNAVEKGPKRKSEWATAER